MRQLKSFMKARKRKLWCECQLLWMWRSGQFCGCNVEWGDTPTPTPDPVPEKYLTSRELQKIYNEQWGDAVLNVLNPYANAYVKRITEQTTKMVYVMAEDYDDDWYIYFFWHQEPDYSWFEACPLTLLSPISILHEKWEAQVLMQSESDEEPWEYWAPGVTFWTWSSLWVVATKSWDKYNYRFELR